MSFNKWYWDKKKYSVAFISHNTKINFREIKDLKLKIRLLKENIGHCLDDSLEEKIKEVP